MKRMQYLRTVFAAGLKRKCGGNATYVVTSGKLRLRCETPAAVAQSACERKQGRKNHLKRLKQIAFQKNIRRFQKNGIMKKMIHLRIRCLAVQIKECGGYAINAVMAGRLLRIQEHQAADALVARVVL